MSALTPIPRTVPPKHFTQTRCQMLQADTFRHPETSSNGKVPPTTASKHR